MSATEIINELPKLSEGERRVVLDKLRELVQQDGEEDSASGLLIDLQARGINKGQAADLRSRLKTFAEDWERLEASIYDEDQAR